MRDSKNKGRKENWKKIEMKNNEKNVKKKKK